MIFLSFFLGIYSVVLFFIMIFFTNHNNKRIVINLFTVCIVLFMLFFVGHIVLYKTAPKYFNEYIKYETTYKNKDYIINTYKCYDIPLDNDKCVFDNTYPMKYYKIIKK